MFDNLIAGRVERYEELFAQARLLRLVPLIGVLTQRGGAAAGRTTTLFTGVDCESG